MQFVRHHNERPFPCPTCGKRFTQKAHLIIHKRTHTGEKPYACHICHKRFAQSSHLAVHKRVHTGEKPFFCNFCGMGFCRRPRLEAHVLQHMIKDGVVQQQQQRSMPASGEMGTGHGGANMNLSLNQESLDAAAQLIELKMKGGGGGISISDVRGTDPYSQSQIKSEPVNDEERMRLRGNLQGNNNNNNNTLVMNEISAFNSKGVIDVTGEDPKEDDILKLKQWGNKNDAETSADLGKFASSGLTELNSIQQQALNNSLVMPSPNPAMLSPTQASSYHHTAAAIGNQNLTMSGLVRTNSRMSLIDFTADDILQHLLSRDDIKSCDFCCLVFKDPAMYYLHRSMHDKMDVRCCNLCGKLLKDKYDFTAHYLNQHK